MTGWSALAIVPAFGIDTLAVAAGLGAAGTVGSWRTAAAFAAFEGLMPVAGALVGGALGAHLGRVAAWAGAALLVALGARQLAEGWGELRQRDDEDETADRDRGPGAAGRGRPSPVAPGGWALMAGGLSVSMDELGAGLGAGAAGLPLPFLAPALAAQAVLCTALGLAAGAGLRRLVGRYGDLAAGVALVTVGLALAFGWR